MPTQALDTTEHAHDGSHGLDDEWPPLEVFDIVKRWTKNGPTILDKLNLTIEKREKVWIGGVNGAGKTTLLRIVSGLIDPTEGQVRAYGLHPVRDRQAYQRRVAFLSAGNSGVYARLTVRGQLDCWARIAYIPRDRRVGAVEEMLDHFGLRAIAGNRSDRLSMGQRQRLRLAMTFVARPDLVLLDEPRNSLDGEGADMLAAAIEQVVDRDGAVLWISPSGEPVNVDFDTRYVLENGQLTR